MRFQTTVDTSNTQINMGDTSGVGGGSQFSLIPADFYTVLIRKMEVGTFQGKSGSYKNPNSADGKWTHVKLIPDMKFFNEQGTEINRQDFVMGVLDNGAFIRPDGDTSKLPIWSGNIGALFMLKSLGLFKDEGNGTFSLNFDAETLTDRIVRVRTAYAGYIKGAKNFDSDEINGILAELYGGQGYSFTDVNPLVLLYNVRNGYSTITVDGEAVDAGDVTLEMCHDVFDPESNVNAEQDDVRLKLKNFVVGWYNLNARDIEEGGFFADPEAEEGIVPQVFVNEQAYEAYKALEEMEEAPTGTDGW